MADPYLDIDEFTAEYQGTLSDGEAVTAGRLLQVVSDGIRALKSDADTTAASQVVFEVVRDAMMYGHLGPLSSFTNTTSRRTESGTFADNVVALNDYLTGRQRRLLGLVVSSTVSPRGVFTAGDY